MIPHARPQRKKAIPPILGLDGEGFDHGSVYAYMAAWDREKQLATLENIDGLSTAAILDYLVALPPKSLKFGFSLGYDMTHWLKDLPDDKLFALNHLEMRMMPSGRARPVWYRASGAVYSLNLLSSRFTVARFAGHHDTCRDPSCSACRPAGKAQIWDIFKFFQSSFIDACLSWKIVSQGEYDLLKRMKAHRPNFRRPSSQDSPEWLEIKHYCGLECQKMAELGHRLLVAHDEAGLTLKNYYGAGSTGAAMLEKMNARRFTHRGKEPAEVPDEVRVLLAMAFFGGRFEISWRGPIPEDVFNYDISSAYPYAFTFLPCLIHGAWEHAAGSETRAAVERANAALVRYSLPYSSVLGKTVTRIVDRELLSASRTPWGPFPFRNAEGNILFPVTSGGGWIHRSEALAGLAHYPNVVFHEAWVYKTACSCEVLRTLMPKNYRLRLEWGKEGRGLVSKLGQNSCYGKTAQTKGNRPPYQNFVWAGMTTASCRAQVLRAMSRDLGSIVMVATDGIASRTRLVLDRPADTGTDDAVDEHGRPARKPLGGWEEKCMHGIHLIRPGVAFPLRFDERESDKSKEKEARARGVGKAVLRQLQDQVVEQWHRSGPVDLTVVRPMFHGMKSQLWKSGDAIRRGARYGTFSEQPVVVSYSSLPKRPWAEGQRLLTWALPESAVSQPYGPILGQAALLSPHTLEILREARLLADQPDGGMEMEGGEF